MAGIKKKESGGFKDKFSTKTKYKETNYYNCGESFLNACGIPGPVMGGINMSHANISRNSRVIFTPINFQFGKNKRWLCCRNLFLRS